MATKSSPRHGAKADRGPARHFHGREHEWSVFAEWLDEVKKGQRNSAFMLVQGAPGAGKSALLHEFGKRAEKRKWLVLLRPAFDVLYDPAALARAGGIRYVTGEAHKKQLGARVEIKAPALLSASVGEQGMRSKSYAPSPVSGVLESLARRNGTGLLLVIDEVQDIALVQSPGKKEGASQTLKWIHNGEANVPVVLLAGGLGHSRNVLEEFGVSRLLSEGGILLLGKMKSGAIRNVIRDWLLEAPSAVRAPKHILDHWVTTLARECDRWPQHMHGYVYPAWRWLQSHKGALPRDVPESVLDHGARRKDEYYVGRVSALQIHHRRALASLLARTGDADYRYTEAELVNAFAEGTRSADPYAYLMSPPEAFKAAVAKGVLAMVSRDGFSVPIPSMYRWLVSTYHRDLIPTVPRARDVNAEAALRANSPMGSRTRRRKGRDGSEG